MDNTGIRIAARIASALYGKTDLSAREIDTLVYGECTKIAQEQELADWLEMPNGTTYTMSFKPTGSPRGWDSV